MTSILRRKGKWNSMHLITILILTWKFATTATFNSTNTTQPSITTTFVSATSAIKQLNGTITYLITENTTTQPPKKVFNATTLANPKTVQNTTGENRNVTVTKIKPDISVNKSSPMIYTTLSVETKNYSAPTTLKMAGYVQVNDSLDFTEKEDKSGTISVEGSGNEIVPRSHNKTKNTTTVTTKKTDNKTNTTLDTTAKVTYAFHKIVLPGKSEKLEDLEDKNAHNTTHYPHTNRSLIVAPKQNITKKASEAAITLPTLVDNANSSINQSSATTTSKIVATQEVKAGLKTIHDIVGIEDLVTIGIQGLTKNEWNTDIKPVVESFLLGYLSGIEPSKLFNKIDHEGDKDVPSNNAFDGIRNKSPKSLNIIYANETPLNMDDTLFVTLYVVKRTNDISKGYLKVNGLNVVRGMKRFEDTLVSNKKSPEESNLFAKLKDRIVYYLNFPPVPLGPLNKLCPVKILGPLSANKQMVGKGQALQFMQPEHVSILTGVALSICLIVILGLVVYFLSTKFRDVRPYDWPSRPRFNSWLFGVSDGRRRSGFRNSIFFGNKRQRDSENVSGPNMEEEMRAINLIDGDDINIEGESNGQPVRSHRYGRQGANKSFSPDPTTKQ